MPPAVFHQLASRTSPKSALTAALAATVCTSEFVAYRPHTQAGRAPLPVRTVCRDAGQAGALTGLQQRCQRRLWLCQVPQKVQPQLNNVRLERRGLSDLLEHAVRRAGGHAGAYLPALPPAVWSVRHCLPHCLARLYACDCGLHIPPYALPCSPCVRCSAALWLCRSSLRPVCSAYS